MRIGDASDFKRNGVVVGIQQLAVGFASAAAAVGKHYKVCDLTSAFRVPGVVVQQFQDIAFKQLVLNHGQYGLHNSDPEGKK